MSVLGVGIDLVEVSEAQRLLDRWGERLLRRVLTEQEQAYVLRNARPAKHLAARLAAKEAVYKALQGAPGSRGVGWRDIEVERDGEGKPSIRLSGQAATIALSARIERISVSLSHTQTIAAAVVVVEKA